MPTDVFLMLCSSSIAVVASLMYFVSDGPVDDEEPEPARPWPRRPPPLPCCTVTLGGLGVNARLRLECVGDEWKMSLALEDRADAPARGVLETKDGLVPLGAVHDLRWHGRAGLAATGQLSWRQPPARA